MSTADHPPFPAALHAMIGARIGSIHGARLQPLIHDWRSKDIKRGHTGYRLHVDGWSPSLHEIDMVWRLTLDLAETPAQMERRAITQIGHQLKLQRTRAAAGLALGHAYPMTIGRVTKTATAIRHLHADASALGLRIAALDSLDAPAGSALEDIAVKLHDIHRAVVATGADTLTEAGSEISDHGRIRTVHVGYDRSADLPGRIALTGRHLSLFDVALPETVLAALPGKRLFALSPIHPVLDGRTIESVKQEAGWLDIMLTPCDVSIDAVWDMPRDDALDLIYTRISTTN